MSVRFPEPARRALRRYDGLPITTRAHVLLRWLSCPFAAVEQEVPTAGSVLDLGCGHGLLSLYLAATAPGRVVQGVDVDGEKLREARIAAAGFADVTFVDTPNGWRPTATEQWDGIVIVDMLYLLGRDIALELLVSAARSLAPGGRLVVKEIDVQPRWKYQLALQQERFATRVAHVTKGNEVDFLPMDELTNALADEGLAVTQRSIDRWYPHPHALVTADRQR